MSMEKLKGRIAKLTSDRDQFLENANRQVAFLNGQIAALEELLQDDQPASGEAEAGAEAGDEAPEAESGELVKTA